MRPLIILLIILSACHKEEPVCSEEKQDFHDACLNLGCTAALTAVTPNEDTADSSCTVTCTCEDRGTIVVTDGEYRISSGYTIFIEVH